MAGGFNFAGRFAGRPRKSLNPNIVTMADTRFYLFHTLHGFS